MQRYKLIKSVGRGSYGEVYLAKDNAFKDSVAIKIVPTSQLSQSKIQRLSSEIEILSKIAHPNIVGYRDSYSDEKGQIHIVMNFCAEGDVEQKIKELKGEFLEEEQIWDWLAQTALGLEMLHYSRIIHRDIKASNILLNGNVALIADFGIAKILEDTSDVASTFIGTPLYMSPELIRNRYCGCKSDVWAMGCLAYQLCYHRLPFISSNVHTLFAQILNGTYEQPVSRYSEELCNLIDCILDRNENTRPTVQDLLCQSNLRWWAEKYIRRKIFMETDNFLHKEKKILQAQSNRLGYHILARKPKIIAKVSSIFKQDSSSKIFPHPTKLVRRANRPLSHIINVQKQQQRQPTSSLGSQLSSSEFNTLRSSQDFRISILPSHLFDESSLMKRSQIFKDRSQSLYGLNQTSSFFTIAMERNTIQQKMISEIRTPLQQSRLNLSTHFEQGTIRNPGSQLINKSINGISLISQYPKRLVRGRTWSTSNESHSAQTSSSLSTISTQGSGTSSVTSYLGKSVSNLKLMNPLDIRLHRWKTIYLAFAEKNGSKSSGQVPNLSEQTQFIKDPSDLQDYPGLQHILLEGEYYRKIGAA